jgi:hypothetical protein
MAAKLAPISLTVPGELTDPKSKVRGFDFDQQKLWMVHVAQLTSNGYLIANTANITADLAYGQANAAYGAANNASITAGEAYGAANVGIAVGEDAYGVANLGYAQANAGYAQANAAYTAANAANGGSIINAYNQANAAYAFANTLVANVSSGNIANIVISGNATNVIIDTALVIGGGSSPAAAYAQANLAYAAANSGIIIAENAYAAANSAIGASGGYTVNSVTLTTTSQSVLVNVSAATYASLDCVIQANCKSSFYTTKMLIVYDGTNTYLTEYGSILTDGVVGTISAGITAGNVQVLFTSNNATSTVVRTAVFGLAV